MLGMHVKSGSEITLASSVDANNNVLTEIVGTRTTRSSSKLQILSQMPMIGRLNQQGVLGRPEPCRTRVCLGSRVVTQVHAGAWM